MQKNRRNYCTPGGREVNPLGLGTLDVNDLTFFTEISLCTSDTKKIICVCVVLYSYILSLYVPTVF